MPEGHGWVDLSEGDESAGYRIELALGRGGMGILYLAIELIRPERPVITAMGE
jgi:hypothetical protein